MKKEVKSAPYPKGFERQFAAVIKAMIAAMAKTFEAQTFKKLGKGDVEKFTDAKSGNYAAVFLKLSKKAQRNILDRFSDAKLDKIVDDMLKKVNQANQKATYAAAAPALGIDAKALMAKEALSPEFNALAAETQLWVKKLRDDTLQGFQANSLRAMTMGLDLDAVISEFDTVKSKKKNAAELTARTQIASYNGLATKLRAQSLGITQAVWVTSRDERVRKCHQVRDGKTYDLDKGLYSSCDGKTLFPGTDFQCFPGDSQLNHTSFCEKLYRRWYAGVLTELVFDDGVVLRATPNHPVFTSAGVKAAKLIECGEDIIRTFEHSFHAPEFNTDSFIPTFEQIFSAFDRLGVEHSISPAARGKFHGDTSDGEVNVIGLDSLLMDEINPSIVEKMDKFGFTISDKMIILEFFTCLGKLDKGCLAFRHPESRLVSIFDLVRTFIGSHLTPLELFGFALGSWGNTFINESLSDNVSGNPKMFSNCILAFATLIHGADFYVREIMSRVSGYSNPASLKMLPDMVGGDTELSCNSGDTSTFNNSLHSVVENRTINFSGHVFNLQSESGYYIAQTAAVGNCRCTSKNIIETGEV